MSVRCMVYAKLWVKFSTNCCKPLLYGFRVCVRFACTCDGRY